MKQSRLRITCLILVAIVIGLLVDKAAIAVESNNVEFDVHASALMEEFEIDEEKATARYASKWLVVKGELEEIEVDQNGDTVIQLKSDSSKNKVRCILRGHLKPDEIDALSFKKPLSIQGKFLDSTAMDILLEKCRII